MPDETVGDLQPEIVIGPLSRSHARGAFSCGRPKIDNFFRNSAREQHESYRVRVFIAVEANQTTAIGFHSLVLATAAPNDVSHDAGRQFARYKTVPVIYLSMIGVDTGRQNQGIGTLLMRDAFERSLVISENAGTYALALDAATDKLVETYKGLGFQLFAEGERRMFITLAEIRKALAG